MSNHKKAMTQRERILMRRCLLLMAGIIFFSFMAVIRARADDLPTQQQRDWRFFFSKMYIADDREAVESTLSAEEVGVAVLTDEPATEAAAPAALAEAEPAMQEKSEEVAVAESPAESPEMAKISVASEAEKSEPEEMSKASPATHMLLDKYSKPSSAVAKAPVAVKTPETTEAKANPAAPRAEPEEIMAMAAPSVPGADQPLLRDKYYAWIVIPTAHLTGDVKMSEKVSDKASEVK